MLTYFKAFMKWSTFCRLHTTELTTPSLRIAQATNERGEAVAFCPIESVMLLSYVLRPGLTKDEAGRAGDAVDAEIAKLGKQLGISKAMIVMPEGLTIPDDEGETIRVHIRKIPQTVAIGLATSVTQSQAGKYLN